MQKESRTIILSSIILVLLVPGILSSLPVPAIHHNSSSIPVQIRSLGLIGADFTFSPTTPVTDQWVQFTATPPSNGTAPFHYFWDFNDSSAFGNTTTTAHKFSGPGVRYVVLTIVDNQTNPRPNTEEVTHQVPITLLSFSLPPTAPLSGQTVQFTATTPSNGTATYGTAPFTYSWNFNDTSTGTGQTVSHIFSAPCSAPKNFNVTLTVTDSSTPTKTFTRSNLVLVTSIDYSITPLAPTSSYDFFSHNQGYLFTASEIGCSSPITYKWDFGDGITASNVTSATSATIHHSYDVGFTSASFTTVLNVTDSATPTPNKVKVSHGLLGSDPKLTVRGIDTQLGIDCGLGTTQAVLNVTGAPVAPTENGNGEISTGCFWIGDPGQTATGSYDGTNEPLVSDQDETLSLINPGIGGGFTADIVALQNSTGVLNAFDLQVRWNPLVLRAVEFDQTGLAIRGIILATAIQTIDNTNGFAELGQAISGTLSGNFTLFRIRFDVIGVGATGINIANINGGITTGSAIVHTTFNGSFDSERFFDPGQTLHWQVNMTLPSPIKPGQPNTFRVQSSCPGCTGPFTYTWQFNSTNTTPFMVQANGNPVTITMPNSTFSGNRITVRITDSATPSPNVVTLTMTMPLTIAIQGTSTVAIGSSATLTAVWLGGLPQYTGTWRLCPGSSSNKAVCSNPAPTLSATQKTSSPISATYNYGGVYNNTLTLTDSSAVSSKTFQLVNVTGAPLAYTIAVSANPTSPLNGTSTAFSATITYNPLYPAGSTFRSTLFTYLWNFGDGSTGATPTTTTTATMNHAYALPGTYVVRVTAQEASTGTPSHIQEVGTFTVTVISPLAGSFSPSIGSAQTGQSITFQSTITGGSGTYTYSWDFGDSTSSMDPNPTHTYANAGTYTVKLTVTDSSGNVFSASSQTVTITAPPPNGSLLIYAIVGVIIAAVVIGALFMLRRRKTPAA